MKQYQMQYQNEEQFSEWLDRIASSNRCQPEPLFHIFTDTSNYAVVKPAVEAIRKCFPLAPYVGTTGHGSISGGESTSRHVVVVASFFDFADTQIEVMQLPLTRTTQDESARKIVQAVSERPWIKAIEIIATINEVDLPDFCHKLSVVDPDIQVYGGGSLALDVYDGNDRGNFVFSSVGHHETNNVVLVLQGGPNLHVHTSYVTGWRRLGLPFQVTAAHDNVLSELNGVPALDLYQQYLGVPRNEHFYDLAVIFPFGFESNGTPYLRVATNFNEDGSLMLGADVKTQTMGNIAYGDPIHIKQRIDESLSELFEFSPQAISLFSCASRQLYWGSEVNRETLPFQSIAPTSGFYTAGEFLRSKGELLLHNVTIVIAGLREGEAEPLAGGVPTMDEEGFSRPLMINNCLTSFINVATEELRAANERLSVMAITDGLTGLYNRTEIERRIHAALATYHKDEADALPPVLVMMDFDHFKDINDTYGHREGDKVLTKAASTFLRLSEREDAEISVGRWGGEEFMFLVCGMELAEVQRFASEVRDTAALVRSASSGTHTMSAGITQATATDTTDTLSSRVDKALYLAKERGRNCSVTV